MCGWPNCPPEENRCYWKRFAFAEGRLLFVHPFPDFNGRATRLLLAEILRRQELPPVELAPENETGHKSYSN